MTPYTPDEVERRLQELVGWNLENGAIARTFSFPTYAEGVAFAVKVALLAERADHHPDLEIGYRRVRVSYRSHDVNGVTERDFEAALKVSQL